MENDKNDNNYNNQNYLSERKIPNQNTEIKNETGNEPADSFEDKTGDKMEQTENINRVDLENDQREIHPEIIRKKSGSKTMFLILAVVVLTIAGAIAAYFLLDIIPKKETPQQIIKSSMQSMQEIKTYNYRGIIGLDVENKENSEGFNFDVELSGKADQTNINNIKSSINLKTTVDISMEGGTQELYFNLDTMQFGQKMTYIKLNDFDLGAIGMMMGSEISSLKEKWYKLDLAELEKLESVSPDSVSGLGIETYDMNKIMGLYGKYELLKFQEDLGDAKLGNIDAYHYKVKLDGIALINFYLDILKELEPTEEQNLEETSAEMFKEIEDSIKKYDYVINDIADNINVEIWIGKKDRFMYRVKIDGGFDKEFVEMLGNKMIIKGDLSEDEFNQEIEDDFEIAFTMDFDMNDFNKPVEINEPAEAENLMEVLEKILGSFLGTSAAETELDTDLDGLPDYLENIYGSDINNPDTDGDGYKDGEEVESGYDPLIPGNARIDYDKLLEKG